MMEFENIKKADTIFRLDLIKKAFEKRSNASIIIEKLELVCFKTLHWKIPYDKVIVHFRLEEDRHKFAVDFRETINRQHESMGIGDYIDASHLIGKKLAEYVNNRQQSPSYTGSYDHFVGEQK